jgi:hypothetical protein
MKSNFKPSLAIFLLLSAGKFSKSQDLDEMMDEADGLGAGKEFSEQDLTNPFN